jgi:formylglycine-generating enzyme
VAWCAPSCLVSFDGYTLASSQGGSAEAGASEAGSTNGGTGSEHGEGLAGVGGSAGDSTAATSGGRPAGGVAVGGEGGLETDRVGPAGEGGLGAGGIIGEAGASGMATGGVGAGAAPPAAGAGVETGGQATGGAASAGETGRATGGHETGGTGMGGDVQTGGYDTGGVTTGGHTGSSGEGGTPSGGSNTGGAEAAGAPSCPVGLAGPAMAEIPKPDGAYFCIDRTEVTNAQYAEFVSAGDTATQPTYCSTNTSFTPQSDADCSTLRYDPIALAQHPVSCVDWCDAYAFCRWAGKHLCGDMAGGSVAPASFADATRDEWYAACSRGGAQVYPYAGGYQAEACVDLYCPVAFPLETGSTPTCEGGYAHVLDLSGNVSEWEDSCSASTGGSDLCVHRGGSFLDADDTSPSVRCDSADANHPETLAPAQRERQSRSRTVGFRCCWEP